MKNTDLFSFLFQRTTSIEFITMEQSKKRLNDGNPGEKNTGNDEQRKKEEQDKNKHEQEEKLQEKTERNEKMVKNKNIEANEDDEDKNVIMINIIDDGNKTKKDRETKSEDDDKKENDKGELGKGGDYDDTKVKKKRTHNEMEGNDRNCNENNKKEVKADEIEIKREMEQNEMEKNKNNEKETEKDEEETEKDKKDENVEFRDISDTESESNEGMDDEDQGDENCDICRRERIVTGSANHWLHDSWIGLWLSMGESKIDKYMKKKRRE